VRRNLGRFAAIAALAACLVAVGLALTNRVHPHLGLGDTAASASPPARTRVKKITAGTRANGAEKLVVTLSARPARGTVRPTITPRIRGHWTTVRRSEVFVPKFGLAPCQRYTLTVPGSTIATGHKRVGKALKRHLKAACLSTLAAQQALARLHYLPFTAGDEALSSLSPNRIAWLAYRAKHVKLVARTPDAPHLERGKIDAVTRGALMSFQLRHHLTPSGAIDDMTWGALLKAEIHHEQSPHPYTWITVSEGSPETLKVHRVGGVVLTTPANTGVPGADTPQGVFPIFTHVASSDMRGTNADGSKYNDPGVPWVSYFTGGDAVHGFPRGSYGSPQSNGCVELPIDTAERVFGMVDIGDLVIVTA
jgi:L,D-transpeptidase catalytic domain